LPQHRAFNGRVLAIVRSKAGQSGPLTLRAESSGLAAAEITLTTTP
jgi:beta-galactosidase